MDYHIEDEMSIERNRDINSRNNALKDIIDPLFANDEKIIWSVDKVRSLSDIVKDDLNSGDIDPKLILELNIALNKYISGYKFIAIGFIEYVEIDCIMREMLVNTDVWLDNNKEKVKNFLK
jgi:hypothetical protein